MRSLRQLSILTVSAMAGLAIPAIAETAGTAGQDSASQGQSQTQMRSMEGAIDVQAITTTFTVQEIDKTARTVTLKAPDGATRTIKLGPEVRNFDQLRQGDQVRATLLEEMAIGVRSGAAAREPGTGERKMIALSPKGAKPGMVMVQSESITAKVLAVDPDKRMVSLEGPAGKDRTIKVGSKVNLDELKKGDSVTVQVAHALAINVQPAPETGAQPSGAEMQPQGSQQQQNSQEKGPMTPTD